jgi:hypothetical protein
MKLKKPKGMRVVKGKIVFSGHGSSMIPAHSIPFSDREPDKEDKGKKDGHCNRSACQRPLAGHPQYWMPNYSGGRYYYCEACEHLFSDIDRRGGHILRCTLDPDTVPLEVA